MNKKKKLLMLTLLLFPFVTGFTNISREPQQLYRVYLKGESLGLIKSKDELEKYIDKEQNEIKKKYNVKKVYAPADLDIVKETTFDMGIKTTKEIYEEIKDMSPFTINGYEIKIKGLNTTTADGRKIKGKTQKLYVLDKDIFTESIERTVKSFITEEDYKNYENDTQNPIDDVGKIIENIYIKNKITIKKDLISVDKKIYTTVDELSKYLLFGTVEDQVKYTIKAGDTIPDVAFNNKISTQEFLIANPDLQDENSLLSPGQEVTLGLLMPQFSVVEQDKVVFVEEKNYTTETQYDNDKYVGWSEVVQAGVKGENKVTQQILKVNGEITSRTNLSTEVIKAPINEIIVKGGKQSAYYGYGTALPTAGTWGWPATCSSISSPFGWRWGALHDGTDIAGCGYGSNIFAAASGVVVVSTKKPGYYPGGYGDNGEYIVIDHLNGYYTLYAHMCPGCRAVKEGDYVEKGQPIGGMGMTGAATGVHLHFGMWQGYPYMGGSPLNAMNYY